MELDNILLKAYIDGIVEALEVRSDVLRPAVHVGEDHQYPHLNKIEVAVTFYWETKFTGRDNVIHTSVSIDTELSQVILGSHEWKDLTKATCVSSSDWLVQWAQDLNIEPL